VTYLDEVAAKIKAGVPAGKLPGEKAEGLFRIYAVLLLAKGSDVTREDVHNAWVAWKTVPDVGHVSLVPFDQLKTDVAAEDEPYVHAIHEAARSIKPSRPAMIGFDQDLFPNGLPAGKELDRLFDLYKLMVASSESLVARRQGVNTFFLSINGALLAGGGFILSNVKNQSWSLAGLVVLAVGGVVLSSAWNSLLLSFGQLNSGKFKIINRIEQLFPAAIFLAEWKALGEGKHPGVYRSFTAHETWVPRMLRGAYLVAALVALALVVPVEWWRRVSALFTA